jgi:hypothetical protein
VLSSGSLAPPLDSFDPAEGHTCAQNSHPITSVTCVSTLKPRVCRPLVGHGHAMVIREEFVRNGVNFLRHPKVREAPLSQRLTFLERKVCTKSRMAHP